jgi:hypothetical protein
LLLQYEQQQQAAVADQQAAKELNFLAHLVHVNKPASDNFKLNLFLDDADLFDEQATASSKPRKQQELEFRGRREANWLGDVLQQVQPNKEDSSGNSQGLGEELLELMDSVA